jgi:transcriptional regulator with XRE-family HTH domain
MGMKDLSSTIAHNLAELRKARGLTQGELAEKFSYSDKSISKWEHGEAIPDVNTLQELADFYGVTIDYLTHEESDASLKEEGMHDPEAERVNRIVLTCLAVVFIWTLASIFFAGFILFPRDWNSWMAFVWAVPASFLALVIANRKWGKKAWSLPLSLTVTITAIISIYLEVSLDLHNWNMWFLILLGVPVIIGQVFKDRLDRSHANNSNY